MTDGTNLDVLDWKRLDIWGPWLLQVLTDLAPLRSWLGLSYSELSRTYEDSEWLDEPLGLCANETLEHVVESIAISVRSIRCYHAGRPVDIPRILAEGLKPLTRAQLECSALSVFSADSVDPHEIKRACAAVDLEPHVYLSIDDRDYDEDCGHYLICGSEALQVVAAQYVRSMPTANLHALRDRLAALGTPTIFVCDVPVRLVETSTPRELAGCLLHELFLNPHNLRRDTEELDFAVKVADMVPGACIVSHYHPATAVDDHRGRCRVPLGSSTCPACS